MRVTRTTRLLGLRTSHRPFMPEPQPKLVTSAARRAFQANDHGPLRLFPRYVLRGSCPRISGLPIRLGLSPWYPSGGRAHGARGWPWHLRDGIRLLSAGCPGWSRRRTRMVPSPFARASRCPAGPRRWPLWRGLCPIRLPTHGASPVDGQSTGCCRLSARLRRDNPTPVTTRHWSVGRGSSVRTLGSSPRPRACWRSRPSARRSIARARSESTVDRPTVA